MCPFFQTPIAKAKALKVVTQFWFEERPDKQSLNLII